MNTPQESPSHFSFCEMEKYLSEIGDAIVKQSWLLGNLLVLVHKNNGGGSNRKNKIPLH